MYKNALALTYVSFGCPVIATKNNGSIEQLGDAAALIDPNDSEEFLTTVEKIIMKFILILLYFLREEIKLNFRRLIIIYAFIRDFSIFRYFIYLFNNSFIPCRDKIFRSYISKNIQKSKFRREVINANANKYVLITNQFNHVGYISAEILVGKNLMEIFNSNGIALLNNYNLKNIILYKSFGIKEIIILGNSNIITRLMYFIKAYLIIRSFKNMDDFLKFNINNVEIGKAVYDHYLRFSGIGTTNEFKRQFYTNLSKSLLVYYQINKYLKKYNIIASVQSEKQFIPGSIIFQSALINGINVYSRVGPHNQFTVKKYSNINERYTHRSRFSKKLIDLVANNKSKEAIEIGSEIIKKRFGGVSGYQAHKEYYGLPDFTKGKKIRKNDKKNISKEDLCKRLGWSPDLSIGVIFSSDLTDGVFDGRWALFRDRLTWLRESLHEIKKNNNMNWLVKPHPNDENNNVITSTLSEFEKICSNHDHVKIFPDNIAIDSIPKIIDVAVTQCGTVSSEYPCFGIPTILAGETDCSGFDYTIEPQSKKEYFFQLQNAKKLEKLNNQQIELAKTFIFVKCYLAPIPINLPKDNVVEYIDERIFWTEMIKILDQYKHEEDLLVNMMKNQVKNNDMHTMDYRIIKKIGLEKALTKLSEE